MMTRDEAMNRRLRKRPHPGRRRIGSARHSLACVVVLILLRTCPPPRVLVSAIAAARGDGPFGDDDNVPHVFGRDGPGRAPAGGSFPSGMFPEGEARGPIADRLGERSRRRRRSGSGPAGLPTGTRTTPLDDFERASIQWWEILPSVLSDAARAANRGHDLALKGIEGAGGGRGAASGDGDGGVPPLWTPLSGAAGALEGAARARGSEGADDGGGDRPANSCLSSLRDSLREVASAASSSTAVAGLAASATVAAAAMAVASAEREVTTDGGRMDEQRLASGGGGVDQNGRPLRIKVKNTDIFVDRRSVSEKRGGGGTPGYGLAGSDGGAGVGRSWRRGRRRRHQHAEQELDSFTVEGARLLSASFALVSNSVGFAADAVRVAGDTAAAAAGSSGRLVGKAMGAIGSVLDGAGGLIEGDTSVKGGETVGGDESAPRRKPLTSERIMEKQRRWDIPGLLHRDGEGPRKGNLPVSARRVVGRSVRLIGNVAEGVGNSLQFAGSATEALASSAAGVAEDAVRVVEDLAGSLSTMFALDARWGREDFRPLHDREAHMSHPPGEAYEPEQGGGHKAFVTFGRNPQEERSQSGTPTPVATTAVNHYDRIIVFANAMHGRITEFVAFAMADTDGVPSMALELLGVLIVCYIASMVLLSAKSRPTAGRKQRRCPVDESSALPLEFGLPTIAEPVDVDTPPSGCEIIGTAMLGDKSSNVVISTPLAVENVKMAGADDSSNSTSSDGEIHMESELYHKQSIGASECKEENDAVVNSNSRLEIAIMNLKTLAWAISWALFVPWRIAWHITLFWIHFTLDRRVVLLGIHCIAWVFLCHVSQMRNTEIRRKSEASGFRSAVASTGTSSPALVESALWLNGLLAHVWRVRYDEKKVVNGSEDQYPTFLLRAMSEGTNGQECTWDGSEATAGHEDVVSKCPGMVSYGGLEPYISSRLGSALIDILDSSGESRPGDIAYISLYSFTLGSKPPIVRGVRLRGFEGERAIRFDVDLDVLLGDSSLVLDIKLSSLDYALLPSTKLSIGAVDVRFPLDISVETIPDFPYVSSMNISLSEVPPCRVKITPLSSDSGLRGIDLGSFPVISQWIQSTIQGTLADYLSPSYISFDLSSLVRTSSAEEKPKTRITAPKSAESKSSGLFDDFDPVQSALPHSSSLAGEKAFATLNAPFPVLRSPQAIVPLAVDLGTQRQDTGGTDTSSLGKKRGIQASRPLLCATSTKHTTKHIDSGNPYARAGSDDGQEEIGKSPQGSPGRSFGVSESLSGPLKIVGPIAVVLAATSIQDLFKEKE